MADQYPVWTFYPARARPPAWAAQIADTFTAVQDVIDTRQNKVRSDAALAALRPGLQALGFEVESGKKAIEKIRRPVLFGEGGSEAMTYEVDAFRVDGGIALEVEAGRGARSNAVYRDLVQTALLVDAEFLTLAVQLEYRHRQAGRDVTVQSYRDTRNLLDAVYASERLKLPFQGLLLLGY